MKQSIKILLLSLLLLWLSGCAAPQPYYGTTAAPVVDHSTIRKPIPRTTTQPAPVEVTALQPDKPIIANQQQSKPKPKPVAATPPPKPQPKPKPKPQAAPPQPKGNKAVVALLDDAANYVGGGQLDKAASSLERALRIEPKNAGIWHDLGQIRLHQREYKQAEAMFSKSNSLAGGDRSLKARNWRMISAARRAGGDATNADAAEAQAVTLEN